MTAIVIVTSKLRDGDHRDRFLDLSAQTRDWLAARPGFLRYELFEGDGDWTDTMLWASVDDARRGNEAFAKPEISRSFAEIVGSYRGFFGVRTALGA